ncbi:MAG: zinc-finger domain-containing protein [Betaproteobacteria bacterium]|nr:zinc-finger domain-containing protein [Betaproteobacteria bacterium]
MSAAKLDESARQVEVTADDLPLACPRPGAPLWARHPRVFLDVLKTGDAMCPYCGTRYVFGGERSKGHH